MRISHIHTDDHHPALSSYKDWRFSSEKERVHRKNVRKMIGRQKRFRLTPED